MENGNDERKGIDNVSKTERRVREIIMKKSLILKISGACAYRDVCDGSDGGVLGSGLLGDSAEAAERRMRAYDIIHTTMNYLLAIFGLYCDCRFVIAGTSVPSPQREMSSESAVPRALRRLPALSVSSWR